MYCQYLAYKNRIREKIRARKRGKAEISRVPTRMLWVHRPSPHSSSSDLCIQAGHVKFRCKRSGFFFATGMFVGTIRSEIQTPLGPPTPERWISQARPAKKY
jgi:hypothetical protein